MQTATPLPKDWGAVNWGPEIPMGPALPSAQQGGQGEGTGWKWWVDVGGTKQLPEQSISR